MQQFLVVYSYYDSVPSKQHHAQLWCKKAEGAKHAIRKALPKKSKILEAWLIEIARLDAPMEQLLGHTKQPHEELMRMVHRARLKPSKEGKDDTVIDIPAPMSEPTKVSWVRKIVYLAVSVRNHNAATKRG